MCPADDYENDELIFLDEDDTPVEEEVSDVWNVLVVDDDEEIHSVTRLALSDLTVSNRKLHFLHAYSGKEALEILAHQGNSIAIILLDVVMETDDAGLITAKKLREELNLSEPRIILRTGQPGYAPEESVIKEYDINDYKTKTELTRGRLVTTIISSIRSYQQILTINQSRLGLGKIISSASGLLEQHSVGGFCEGVIAQISALIDIRPEGLVCARAGAILDKENDDGIYVLGAVGQFESMTNEKLEAVDNDQIVLHVTQCLQNREHIFTDTHYVLYMKSSSYEAAVCLQVGKEIDDISKQLLEVFLSSISIGYENVNLIHQLRNTAFRDWLTKLPNRNEFINMLEDLNRSDCSFAADTVALVDINHFSDVNDGLGQEVGNKLLISVTARLQTYLGHEVKMGRIGADVFGLIGLQDKICPEVISSCFAAPFRAGDHTLPVNVTIGLCRLSDHGYSGLNILKQTNIALNRAKKKLTANFEYYAPEMEEETTWRLGMIRQLRSDFTDKKLEVWYQPQVDLISERIVGMEALLRWPDKDGGYISPALFVPLAEYSGLIIDIGAWVLEQACHHLSLLCADGYNDLRVAVNISMPQFRDPEFVGMVKNTILDKDIKPEHLELEITESVVMDEPQIVVESLQELKRFGVTIAIDDFGTGFSSMSYLQQLPLDRLKVDRAFVKDVSPGKNAFIAETIVTLGNKLGLQTIAEGVEEREQASHMLKLGCDEAQGFLYAKPMPFDQLVTFLQEYPR